MGGSASFLFFLCGSWVCGLGKKRPAWSRTAAPKASLPHPPGALTSLSNQELAQGDFRNVHHVSRQPLGSTSGWGWPLPLFKGNLEALVSRALALSLPLPLPASATKPRTGGPRAARLWLLRKPEESLAGARRAVLGEPRAGHRLCCTEHPRSWEALRVDGGFGEGAVCILQGPLCCSPCQDAPCGEAHSLRCPLSPSPFIYVRAATWSGLGRAGFWVRDWPGRGVCMHRACQEAFRSRTWSVTQPAALKGTFKVQILCSPETTGDPAAQKEHRGRRRCGG